MLWGLGLENGPVCITFSFSRPSRTRRHPYLIRFILCDILSSVAAPLPSSSFSHPVPSHCVVFCHNPVNPFSHTAPKSACQCSFFFSIPRAKKNTRLSKITLINPPKTKEHTHAPKTFRCSSNGWSTPAPDLICPSPHYNKLYFPPTAA